MDIRDGETVRKSFETQRGMMHITNRRVVVEESDGAVSIGFADLMSYGVAGKLQIRLVWGGRQMTVVRIRGEPAAMAEAAIREALEG